jgi:P27 family predicted phage terminase small subunit
LHRQAFLQQFQKRHFVEETPMFGHADPLKLQILSGTFQADRPVVPECPEYLDPVAKNKWNELCDVLSKTGLLTNADRDVMAMYCSAFSQWREAADMVKKSGLIVRGTGGVCANPCVQIAANAKREMRDLLTLLGLDPASRKRLRGTGLG